MLNVQSIKVTYKRISQNGICKFIGENKEKILIDKESLDGVELIKDNCYLLKIFRSNWELYVTNQIGAMKNIVSIECID